MTAVSLSPRIIDLLADPNSRLTVLTGAGISAESGVPTFRGPEGYWTVGSEVYMPSEIATRSFFDQQPQTAWEWYLHRLAVCFGAEPNAGHRALVRMEEACGDRFTLITQNIDNLHLRAGNSAARTLQIHGNIGLTRCASDCSSALTPLAEPLQRRTDRPGLNRDEWRLLHCPECGGWLRPHVLWFDEHYNEEWYRAQSALEAAGNSDLLIIAGTSGATALPHYIAETHLRRQRPIIDINLEVSPFSVQAYNSPGGMFLQHSCSDALAVIDGHVQPG